VGIIGTGSRRPAAPSGALGPFMRRKLEALFAASVAAVAREAEAAEPEAKLPTP